MLAKKLNVFLILINIDKLLFNFKHDKIAQEGDLT